jgi:hypothetical protein
MTTHGFRTMARTILDEVLVFRADFVEHHTPMRYVTLTDALITALPTCQNAIR